MACSILILPDEVLRETFSHVLTPVTVSSHTTGKFQFSDIISIRSVCRRFRAVFNELPFWYDGDFDLLDLISNREWLYPIELFEDCRAFLEDLLSERQLIERFVLRSKWRFRNLISFQTVHKFVPSFSENTTAVVLESDFTRATASTKFRHGRSWESPLTLRGLSPDDESDCRWLCPLLDAKARTPIQRFLVNLGNCHCLTTLQLSTIRAPLDLDSIVRFCPQIKGLRLTRIMQYKGNLQGLSLLQELDVRNFTSPINVPMDYILPKNSALSLTRLSIVHDEWMDPEDDISPVWPTLLDVFLNVTSLCISPVTDSFCDFIVRANLSLIDFRAQVTHGAEVTMTKVVDIFSAQSLRNLRHLRFSIRKYKRIPAPFLRLLEAIVSNLHLLKELSIAMALNLSWCTQLIYLVNLEKLAWYYPDDDCRDSENLLFKTGLTLKVCNDEEYKKGSELVMKSFDAAFARFIMKPLIKTQLTKKNDVDQEWLNLMTEDSHKLFQLDAA
jgi:hypothetical protein